MYEETEAQGRVVLISSYSVVDGKVEMVNFISSIENLVKAESLSILLTMVSWAS